MIKKETVLKIIDNYTCAANPEDPYPAYGTIAGMFDVLSILKEEISKLPDEDNWIPVSERLPEFEGTGESSRVIITALLGNGEYVCDIGSYSFVWDKWATRYNDFTVTAWQPLPEPYKGE